MVNGDNGDDGQTLTQEEAEQAVEEGEADVIIRGPGGEVQEAKELGETPEEDVQVDLGDGGDGDGDGDGGGGGGSKPQTQKELAEAAGAPEGDVRTRVIAEDVETGETEIKRTSELEEGVLREDTAEAQRERQQFRRRSRQTQRELERQMQQEPDVEQPGVPEQGLPGEPGQDFTPRQQAIREQAARIQRFQRTGPGITPAEEAVIQRGVIDLERAEARENLQRIEQQQERIRTSEEGLIFTVGGEELSREQVLSRLESEEEELEEFLTDTESLRRVEEAEEAEAERIRVEQEPVGETPIAELSTRELEALGAEIFREEREREEELREAGGFERVEDQGPVIPRLVPVPEEFEELQGEEPSTEELESAFGGIQIGERTEEIAVARTLPAAAVATARDPERFASRAAEGIPAFLSGFDPRTTAGRTELEQELVGEVFTPLSLVAVPSVQAARGEIPEALAEREAEAPFTQQLDLREGDLPGAEELATGMPGETPPAEPPVEPAGTVEPVEGGLQRLDTGEGIEIFPGEAGRERMGEPQRPREPSREEELGVPGSRQFTEDVVAELEFLEETGQLSREQVIERTGLSPEELVMAGVPVPDQLLIQEGETAGPMFLSAPPGTGQIIERGRQQQREELLREDVRLEDAELGQRPEADFQPFGQRRNGRERAEENIFAEEAVEADVGVEALFTPVPDQEAAQAQPQVQLQEQAAALDVAFGQPAEPAPGVGQQPEFAPEQAPPELGFLSQQTTRTRTRVGRGRDEDETELDRELESAFGLEVEEIPQASLTGAGREAPGDGVTPEVFTGAEIRFRGGEIASSEDLEEQLGI